MSDSLMSRKSPAAPTWRSAATHSTRTRGFKWTVVRPEPSLRSTRDRISERRAISALTCMADRSTPQYRATFAMGPNKVIHGPRPPVTSPPRMRVRTRWFHPESRTGGRRRESFHADHVQAATTGRTYTIEGGVLHERDMPRLPTEADHAPVRASNFMVRRDQGPGQLAVIGTFLPHRHVWRARSAPGQATPYCASALVRHQRNLITATLRQDHVLGRLHRALRCRPPQQSSIPHTVHGILDSRGAKAVEGFAGTAHSPANSLASSGRGNAIVRAPSSDSPDVVTTLAYQGHDDLCTRL
jgi:hypothetical protein